MALLPGPVNGLRLVQHLLGPAFGPNIGQPKTQGPLPAGVGSTPPAAAVVAKTLGGVPNEAALVAHATPPTHAPYEAPSVAEAAIRATQGPAVLHARQLQYANSQLALLGQLGFRSTLANPLQAWADVSQQFAHAAHAAGFEDPREYLQARLTAHAQKGATLVAHHLQAANTIAGGAAGHVPVSY